MKSRLGKNILRHRWVQALLALLVASYIRLVMCANRLERHIAKESEPYTNGEKQAIFAFWHGRLLLFSAFRPPGRAIHVLISGHRDGLLISRTVAHFDIHTVEGSSSRNGGAALRQMLRLLRQGDNITITPDGPRGPREEAAPGIVYLAKASGLPIIPVAWSASKHKRLSSWDRFMLPLPFGRIALVVAPPLLIAREEEEASACKNVAATLQTATQKADALTGSNS